MTTMIRQMRRLAAIVSCLAAAGCAASSPSDYTAFRAADPHSILIVPAVNRSVYVNAPDYLLSTIARPVAERGYYVFPVNLVKRVLEDDGLSDANLVHEGDPHVLGEMFGADAVLYVTVEKWESQYIVLSATTTVELDYLMKDTRTGQTLWKSHETVAYTPNSGGSGLGGVIATAIMAAVEKADPNYIPLARQANGTAVTRSHKGMPAGPYSGQYKKDAADF